MLDERKEQSLRQVGGVLWSLAQNFERTQKKSEELLAERLSWGRTFQLIFRKQKWHTEFQESIDQQLRDTLKRQIANSIELLETDLKAVWQQLHESIQKTFAAEVPAPPAPPDFINERDQLLKRIELTLIERMSGRAIEEQMTRMFDDAAAWMRLPAGIAVAGGAATVAAAPGARRHHRILPAPWPASPSLSGAARRGLQAQPHPRRIPQADGR